MSPDWTEVMGLKTRQLSRVAILAVSAPAPTNLPFANLDPKKGSGNLSIHDPRITSLPQEVIIRSCEECVI